LLQLTCALKQVQYKLATKAKYNYKNWLHKSFKIFKELVTIKKVFLT